MSLETEWARCSPWIDAALAHAGRTHDLPDVLELIEAGDAQFWPGRAAAMVTEVNDFPRAKVLSLWLAGGDLAELISELRPKAEAWGRAQGCTQVTILGRSGWERALRDCGYEPAARLVMKDLANEL